MNRGKRAALTKKQLRNAMFRERRAVVQLIVNHRCVVAAILGSDNSEYKLIASFSRELERQIDCANHREEES